MTTDKIISAISRRLGIESLNEMQRQMLETEQRAITLIAPTGSGKTLAFSCRMLRALDNPREEIQVAVIAPSRELVIQISSVLRPIAEGYKTVALYGGHSVADECRSLSPVPDIVIATPGRLLDHIRRGNVNVGSVSTLVLDEYDKALQLGFEAEMKRIVSRIGKLKNLILTSATEMTTVPDYLPLGNALHIDFSRHSAPNDRLQTVEVVSFSRDKLDTLVALLGSFESPHRSIVFVNHRESAERVYARLRSDNIPAILYHGALDQRQREMAVDLFANGTALVLVATDLAARGLDIEGVENVVHYHLPVNEQAWVHRNGRTARQNASGTAWVIVSEADNRPDFITTDRSYQPVPGVHVADTPVSTLYISAGKKEKISRGDVAGFVSASGVTAPDEIGRIIVHDHHALVAVPASKASATATALSQIKLKGKKQRVSVVKF